MRREKSIVYFFIYRGNPRRNPCLPGEMINIEGEVLQPFLTFQAEVNNEKREVNSFFFYL